jgi:Bax protein
VNFASTAAGPSSRWLPRSPRARWVLVGTAVIGVTGALIFTWPEQPLPALAESAGRDPSEEKKAAFINFLLPHVRVVNAGILRERRRLNEIRKDVAQGGKPGFFDARWLKKVAEDYECEVPAKIGLSFIDQLLVRVDVVPASLVIAQAAEESGWGTSRFAVRGNNLFGMRVYDGRGLVPRARERGEKFKVATYGSVRESIADYINNLNTGENYLDLRMTRRDLRRRGQPATGAALASGLASYSSRGPGYVESIRAIIAGNKLGRFDS